MKKLLVSFTAIMALCLISQTIFASAYKGHKGEYKKEGFTLNIKSQSVLNKRKSSYCIRFNIEADENYLFSNKTAIIYKDKEYFFEAEEMLEGNLFAKSKTLYVGLDRTMKPNTKVTFVCYIKHKNAEITKDKVTLNLDNSEFVRFGVAKLIITEVKGNNNIKTANSYEYENDSIDRNLVTEKINNEFTEIFGGGDGFRFKVRNVKINNKENIVQLKKGGLIIDVSMEILHDCEECGNAVNQIIVGIGGEDRAQVSVWNGKKRSGGQLMIVNPYTKYHALCEDNPGKAQWVKVYFQLKVPEKSGVYYIRTRYAQDYQGNLRTEEGLKHNQKIYEAPLGWWRVDRPNGPGSESNIGAIIVE